jgi:hypothetical protein
MPSASKAMRVLVIVGLTVRVAPNSLHAQTAAAQYFECHTKTTTNIVSDWKLQSKHSGAEDSCVSCHQPAQFCHRCGQGKNPDARKTALNVTRHRLRISNRASTSWPGLR